MFRLEWGNIADGYILIGEYSTQGEMLIAIKTRIEQIKFKSYYMRGWETSDGYTMCDYGSHTNFFRYKRI